MADTLPSCRCVAAQTPYDRLSSIYCALLQIAGGTSGTSTFNNIVVNDNAWFKGTVEDGSGSVGTAGQIFTSTGTGTAWSSVYTLLVSGVSTTIEHSLVGNYTAAGFTTANVLSVRHLDAVNGCSAIRCLDPATGNEKTALGYAAGNFQGGRFNASYFETSDANNSGAAPPLRLIQTSTLSGTKAYGPIIRFNISDAAGGPITINGSTESTVFTLTDTGVSITGNLTATGIATALYRHTENASVDGGGSTSGSWQTCPINVETSDPGGIGTLSGNAVTLIAGTYEFYGNQVFVSSRLAQLRLFNQTDNAVIAGSEGLTVYMPAGGSIAFGETRGVFTIASSKAIRMEYQVQDGIGGAGLGASQGWGTNTYANLQFKRIG